MRWSRSLALIAGIGTRVQAAFPSYPNEFVAPNVLVNASGWPETTLASQRSIIKFADEILREGPWCEFFWVAEYPNHKGLPLNNFWGL
jgi:hypothetical protein